MIDDSGLEDLLLRANSGEISVSLAYVQASSRIRSLSRSVHREWSRRLPFWFVEEDIYQVMSLTFCKEVVAYDPKRSTATALVFVTWHMVAAAKKAIHKARNAKRKGGKGAPSPAKSPSRCELLCEQLFNVSDGGFVDIQKGMSTQADQEQVAHASGVFEKAISKAKSSKKMVLLRALARSGGSLDEAVSVILADASACIECGVETEGDARRLLREVLRGMQGVSWG